MSSLFFNEQSFEFLIRLGINIVSVLILIRFVYYTMNRNREYFFTFTIFNLLIFLIASILNKVDMSMGAAFGLFAVFSMLRYRTEGLSMKDMTYLFLVIGMGLITAVTKGEWWEVLVLNSVLILITYLLESNVFLRKELSQQIQYEHIELIKPERREEMLEDIQERTGLKVHRVVISNINFLKDTALLTVYYYE